MSEYYSLAYIMKTKDLDTPTDAKTETIGDVIVTKGPLGIDRTSILNLNTNDNILGLTGDFKADRIYFNHDNNNINIGKFTGEDMSNNTTRTNAIAIGTMAGQTGQGYNAVAIGYQAGMTGQGYNAVAIGAMAGQTGQGYNSVAIGAMAGQTGQGYNSVAIGAMAGQTGQGYNAVAIGASAGSEAQGGDSIAIGYKAGETSQAENTIILNATGAALDSVGNASACYIKPIRTVDTSYNLYEPLAYNKTTGELVSGNNVGFKMITDSFSVSGGGSSGGNDKLFAYSYDGITWEQDDSGKADRTFTDGSCNAIGYDGTVWVAGGVGESAIVHSANGITWERNNDTMRTVLDSGSWRNAVDISCDLVGSGEKFGSSVGLDQSGNVMAVGAYGYNSNEGNVSLYDYSMNSDSWVKTYDLSSNVAGESFGYSLAMSRIDATTTRIAIGAPTNNTAYGQVYVYDTSYNEDTWGDRRINLVDAAIVNVGANEKFGSAIAMNALGTRLLIGAPEYGSGTGAVYNFDLIDNVWTRHPTSNIFDGTSGNFGHSIAMNAAGTRCLIGEPNLTTGHVYSYDFSPNSGYWGSTSNSTNFMYDQQLSYPIVGDAIVGEAASFGHVISMNDAGDWCAVGSPTAVGGRGWVGIYSRNYRLWSLYSGISGQNAGDNFGSSVQMNGAGDRLIVGAKGHTSNVGWNFVYNYNPNTLAWDFERVIQTSNGGPQGETLALDTLALALDTLGNRFVSGTPTNNTNKGAIAVYDRQMKGNALTANGGNWIAGGNAVRAYQNQDTTPFAYSADGITNWQKPAAGGAALAAGEAVLRKELFYTPSASGNFFGNACAMNAAGTRLAVGSYAGGNDKGRVCIYDYDMSLNDWLAEPTKVLTGSSIAGASAGAKFFGMSVALNAAGDRLVVGEPWYDDIDVVDRGKIYIYHYNYTTGQWPTTETRTYAGDTISDVFGVAVAINAAGNRIAIGAPYDDEGETDAGAVFIVDYNETTGSWPDSNSGTNIIGRIKVSCGNGNVNMGGSLSFNAAGDVLVIGGPTISTSATGRIFIIERDNTTGGWGRLDGTTGTDITLLTNNYLTSYNLVGPSNNTNFGRSVSLNAKGDRLAVGEYEYSTYTGRVHLIHYDYQNKRWWTDGNTITNCSTLVRYYEGWTTYTSFGQSLKFNAAGDRLLIGDQNDLIIANGGSVYVIDYNAETGGWPVTTYGADAATYTFNGETLSEDTFGGSVAINALGNRIACGAAANGTAEDFNTGNASDKYGSENGYVRLYDLTTRPIQLADCRALTTFNGNVIAGGKGSGKHMFALSSDSGVSWTNQQVDDEALFNATYDWSGTNTQVSKFTEQFFGVGGGTADSFGNGCAINAKGTRCVIGATSNNSKKGKLYFFHNDDGNGWTLTFTYSNANANGGTEGLIGMTKTLAINDAGDRVIAGAQYNDFNTGDSGSLYIFDYYDDGKGWVETRRIDGSTTNYNLGSSCAMNAAGDRFIVGEIRYGTQSLGVAYIYHYSNGTWSLAKTYTDGTTSIINNIKFGDSCAMNGAGDRVVVGCTVDKKVFIYDYNYVNGAWNTTKTIELTSGVGIFGISCSLNTAGNRLVVGDNITNGAAYIYQRDTTGAWSLVRTYTGEVSGHNYFGYSVALDGSGDRVIIGAYARDTNGLTDNGAAYIYSYDYANNQWPLTTTNVDISFNGIAAGDRFGVAVAFTRLGNKVLIGADMLTSANYGRAYLYEAARSSSDIHCNALAAKGSDELLVAGLGGTSVINPLAWSADGITWNLSDNGATIFTGSGAECKAVAWNGSRWVAGGKSSGSGGPLAYSYNGKKWYKSMNGLALLGSASTCNAVSWNGKYWLASVEGDSGGQTQVYSNDGMSWLASNNGDVLFSGTSQALALATVKTGGAGGGSTIKDQVGTLQSEVGTLQLTQFGIGQRWYLTSNVKDVVYTNNTSKTIGVSVTMYHSDVGLQIVLYVDEQITGALLFGVTSGVGDVQQNLFGLVPPNSTYRVYSDLQTNYQIREFS